MFLIFFSAQSVSHVFCLRLHLSISACQQIHYRTDTIFSFTAFFRILFYNFSNNFQQHFPVFV